MRVKATLVSSLFQKMVCHGEHTYLFAQAMMSVLAQEEQGGSAVRRIAQEVQRFAQEKYGSVFDCSVTPSSPAPTPARSSCMAKASSSFCGTRLSSLSSGRG